MATRDELIVSTLSHIRRYGATGGEDAFSLERPTMENVQCAPSDDLSRSLAPFTCDATAIAVVELSQKIWLVGGISLGINRHPEKKIVPDEQALLRLLHRWRGEAGKAGHTVSRIAVAFEAGRDGF
jgi:hypothetical protein